MSRRFGTIAHIGNPSMGLAAVTALLLAAKNYKPKPPTPEQVAASDKRTERQRWNDEVDARKVAKKSKEPSHGE